MVAGQCYHGDGGGACAAGNAVMVLMMADMIIISKHSKSSS